MNHTQLVKWCGRLRSHLLHMEQATLEEIREAWPRSECDCVRKPEPCKECRAYLAEESEDGLADEWLKCLGDYRHMQGRARGTPTRREEADAELLKAARDEPVPVSVWAPPGDDGTGPTKLELEAWPKSTSALMGFADRDWCIQWLIWRRETLRKAMENDALDPSTTPQPRELLRRAGEEIAHQLAVLCAAATQEGPAVDWEVAQSPPEAIQRLGPTEVAQVHQAFMEANAWRLTMLDTLVAPRSQTEEKPMSWSVFGATYSNRMDMPPKKFMEEVSLASALAQIRLGQPDLEDEMAP